MFFFSFSRFLIRTPMHQLARQHTLLLTPIYPSPFGHNNIIPVAPEQTSSLITSPVVLSYGERKAFARDSLPPQLAPAACAGLIKKKYYNKPWMCVRYHQASASLATSPPLPSNATIPRASQRGKEESGVFLMAQRYQTSILDKI